jgi:outer membrane protein
MAGVFISSSGVGISSSPIFFTLHEVAVKTIVALVMILAFVALPGVALSQAQKIGFVNSGKIFDDLPEAREISKRLESLAKPIQDSLALLQKEIETKVDDYQKKESMLNDAAKRAAVQEIQELQATARDYAQKKDSEMAHQREVLLAPLKEKILKSIEKIAKAEKYNFVFDRTEQVNILLYADTKDDLTNRVLDNLKRGK